MKTFYFLFLLNIFFISSELTAQQTTYIPDDNFEQALIDLGYDNVLDNYVTTSNIMNITNLDVRFNGISDLTGIASFIGLVDLNCSFNNLNVIDISDNTTLTKLSCVFNDLVSLDLGNNLALTYLDCGLNNITSLDVSGNLALTVLYCDYNSLVNLDVRNSNNANFTYFYARNNPSLSCIEVDDVAYSTANWTNKDVTASFSTDCEGGGGSPGLTFVPDNNFEQALIDLGYDNVLDDYVSTANISGVTSLNVSNRGIGDLTGIESFSDLATLYCSKNNLTSLDLSSNVSLTFLNCSLNSLNSLDISNNVLLTSVTCFYNNLVSLNAKNGNNVNFTGFDARYNSGLSCIEVDSASYSTANWTLRDASASYSTDCEGGGGSPGLTFVPDNNFEQALIDLGYDNVLDDYVSTANISGVTSLNVSNRGIGDLTGIESFSDLATLYCSKNNLTSLDLSSNVSLTYLNCSLNSLNSLDISNNVLLKSLTCFYNNLVSLNAKNGNNVNFTSFDARYNSGLSCIEVDSASYSTANWPNRDVTASYSTDCEGGGGSPGLTFVPDNNFEQALIDLGYDNVLDDYVSTANISGVTSLNVSNRGIGDLTGIESFSDLATLYCSKNNLTSLDLSSNVSLTFLNCSLNSLNSLDISNNVLLKSLTCFYNNLVSLNAKNGNNVNFTGFDARYNSGLSCIEVDNASYSTANWPNRGVTASYSTDCEGGGGSPGLTFVPDNNFEQALIDLGYDNVLDDYVSTANISGVTSLNVSNRGIVDLTGIESFSDLATLYCSKNNLTSLDLSSNVSLTFLNCSLNSLNSLDISNNVLLKSLTCFYNNLVSLNAKNGNNVNFTGFDVRYNSGLSCIKVDNVTYSTANWANRDAGASFSTNCGVSARSNLMKENNAFLSTNQLEESSFKLYPNPVKDVLNIQLNKGFELKIVNFYNAFGQRIFSTKTSKIDVSNLASGIYLIELETNQGKSTKKVVIQ